MRAAGIFGRLDTPLEWKARAVQQRWSFSHVHWHWVGEE